jgi:hypothetical protein
MTAKKALPSPRDFPIPLTFSHFCDKIKQTLNIHPKNKERGKNP